MDIPIPNNSYTGAVTPFGGSSLEWVFDHWERDAEEAEEARMNAWGVPLSIQATISHLRRILIDIFPRNSATFQRKILCVGVPVMERLLGKYPKAVGGIEESYLCGSTDNAREYSMRVKSVYRFDLGPTCHESYTIYARNKEYISKIHNMADDVGLSGGEMAVLCLTVGLAQSLNALWVPLGWRERFIKEIKYFDAWLAANWR